MTQFEIITTVISGFALIASTISLLVNYKISKRQNILDEELKKKQINQIESEESEKSKAQIKVERDNSRLYITNIGLSSAKNLTFEIHPRENKGLPTVPRDMNKFPFKNLDPGDNIELLWSITSGTAKQFDTICKWDNVDGSEGIKETFIS